MTDLQEDLGILFLQEKFNTRYTDLLQIVGDTKTISKTNFSNNLQKGDIILVYPKLEKISTFRKINYIGNSRTQGISFSSSKIYIGDGKVSGFGINFKEGPSVLSIISVKEFINNYQGLLVLRHIKMTEEKADKVIEYMTEKMNAGVKYSSTDCFISIFKHIFKKTGQKLSKNFVNQFKGDLFCSNIINLAYINAGLDTGIKDIHGLYVWPIDFLRSKKFKPIFKYFEKGEL